MRISKYLMVASFLCLGAMPAWAEETPVSVSVQANDAKFIGTSMDGVEVVIRDAMTNEILTEGMIGGGTGDTSLIMAEQIGRGQVLRTEGSARYDATLDLAKPTKVLIEAKGPLVNDHSIQTVSQERILIPGKDYSDRNGITMVMPGNVVKMVEMDSSPKVKESFRIAVDVMKMCGCPLQTKGPWLASDYEVEAHIYKGDERVKTVAMDFTGEKNRFATDITMDQAGEYDIIVTAHNPNTKDSGMDSAVIDVQ